MRGRLHYERSSLVERAANEYAETGKVFPDWEVVFYFYQAVHLIEAYFASKQPPIANSGAHSDRLNTMRRLPELASKANFMAAYRGLQQLSEQVRYDPAFRVDPDDVDMARASLRTVISVLDAKVKRLTAGA